MERILVRLPNWLGDALLARPLLHALRAAHPSAALRAVGPAPLIELLAADPVTALWDAWPATGRERRRLVAALRAWRAELALVLPPSFSSAWFAWRSGARRRVGYAHQGRGPLLSRAPRRLPRGDRHLSEEYLDLGRALGIAPAETPPLRPPAEAHEAAARLLEARGFSAARYALLGPGALYGPAKRWDTGRFGALARALAGDGLPAVVCGTGAERDQCEQVARAAGKGALVIAGETGLEVQAALCARAALSVCNDSGLAHLSAAVGSPTVAIFGSTSSAWSAPLGDRVRVVQRAPVCSPCFQRRCRIGYRCLVAIEVEDVLRACREVMA